MDEKKEIRKGFRWDEENAGELGFQPPFEWIDEEWLIFAAADRQIAAELEMSRGVSKRTLRELCTTGDVRSIVTRHTDPHEYPVSIEHIKPSEWVDHELDLECNWLTYIMVSVNDLEYWLGKQPNRKPQEKLEWFTIDLNSLSPELRVTYEKLVEARRKFVQSRKDWLDKQATKPEQQGPKALGKRPRIRAHLAKLYPQGVPDPAFCNRKHLRLQILERDPTLDPLDEETLQKAIKEYDAELVKANRSP
jgi:hypothetical protein